MIKEITDLQLQYSKAEIINIDIEKEKSNGKVSIGSKVTILMNFGDETDEETFTLTGGFGNIEDNVISINSPLGRCIIDKPLGYEGSYKVKENTIKVKILSIDN